MWPKKRRIFLIPANFSFSWLGLQVDTTGMEKNLLGMRKFLLFIAWAPSGRRRNGEECS